MNRTTSGEGVFRAVGNRERLVDRVVDEIQHMIIEGTLEAGMKLPGERELAEQFGVSRTVIREAVKTLLTKGLLDLKHGVGTFIRAMDTEQISGPLAMLLHTKGITLEDLHQVRMILEVEIAGRAAKEASDSDIAHLQEVLSALEQNMNDPAGFALGDSAFHHALAELSHNPLLVMLLDSIGGLMQDVRMSVSDYPELFQTAMPDHREVLASVKARDPARAQRAMRRHLGHARKIQELYLRDKEAAAGRLVSIGAAEPKASGQHGG